MLNQAEFWYKYFLEDDWVLSHLISPSPNQPLTSTLAHIPISKPAAINLPTLDFSPSVRLKQSQGLFPALLFPAPRSSPQELKSSSATEVTEAVETVL